MSQSETLASSLTKSSLVAVDQTNAVGGSISGLPAIFQFVRGGATAATRSSSVESLSSSEEYESNEESSIEMENEETEERPIRKPEKKPGDAPYKPQDAWKWVNYLAYTQEDHSEKHNGEFVHLHGAKNLHDARKNLWDTIKGDPTFSDLVEKESSDFVPEEAPKDRLSEVELCGCPGKDYINAVIVGTNCKKYPTNWVDSIAFRKARLAIFHVFKTKDVVYEWACEKVAQKPVKDIRELDESGWETLFNLVDYCKESKSKLTEFGKGVLKNYFTFGPKWREVKPEEEKKLLSNPETAEHSHKLLFPHAAFFEFFYIAYWHFKHSSGGSQPQDGNVVALALDKAKKDLVDIRGDGYFTSKEKVIFCKSEQKRPREEVDGVSECRCSKASGRSGHFTLHDVKDGKKVYYFLCASCQHEVKRGQKYCDECGNSLSVEFGQKYCHECGNSISINKQ